jgi:glycosyltransferase involved in cell wall biosynthesis
VPPVPLVHDYLLVMRGAERTFATLCDLWPNATVSSLLYDGTVFDNRLAGHPVRTSPLQRLGAKQSTFKVLLPLLPWAAGRLDVSGHDVVLSSSSAFAHGVRPDAGAIHVCYCHTPFRYAWHEREAGLAQAPRAARPFVKTSLRQIRAWDRRVAQRGTRYVANSRITQQRMSRFWGVRAPIVHPPVDVARFSPGKPEDFFLVVCELVRHKRVDLALEAARQANVPIKVVGGGADEQRLRHTYGDDAEFLGRCDDKTLADLYARARALVIPNAEEFGITAVEAQAAGRPVVAVAAGGALETVIHGKTGLLVPPLDRDALASALRNGVLDEVEASVAISNALRFSTQVFQARMSQLVSSALEGGPLS